MRSGKPSPFTSTIRSPLSAPLFEKYIGGSHVELLTQPLPVLIHAPEEKPPVPLKPENVQQAIAVKVNEPDAIINAEVGKRCRRIPCRTAHPTGASVEISRKAIASAIVRVTGDYVGETVPIHVRELGAVVRAIIREGRWWVPRGASRRARCLFLVGKGGRRECHHRSLAVHFRFRYRT